MNKCFFKKKSYCSRNPCLDGLNLEIGTQSIFMGSSSFGGRKIE